MAINSNTGNPISKAQQNAQLTSACANNRQRYGTWKRLSIFFPKLILKPGLTKSLNLI